MLGQNSIRKRLSPADGERRQVAKKRNSRGREPVREPVDVEDIDNVEVEPSPLVRLADKAIHGFNISNGELGFTEWMREQQPPPLSLYSLIKHHQQQQVEGGNNSLTLKESIGITYYVETKFAQIQKDSELHSKRDEMALQDEAVLSRYNFRSVVYERDAIDLYTIPSPSFFGGISFHALFVEYRKKCSSRRRKSKDTILWKELLQIMLLRMLRDPATFKVCTYAEERNKDGNLVNLAQHDDDNANIHRLLEYLLRIFPHFRGENAGYYRSNILETLKKAVNEGRRKTNPVYKLRANALPHCVQFSRLLSALIVKLLDEVTDHNEKYVRVLYAGESIPLWMKRRDVNVPKDVTEQYKESKKQRGRRKRAHIEGETEQIHPGGSEAHRKNFPNVNLNDIKLNIEELPVTKPVNTRDVELEILDDILRLPMTGTHGPPQDPRQINEQFIADQSFEHMWDRAHNRTVVLEEGEVLYEEEACGFKKGLTAIRVVRYMRVNGDDYASVEFAACPPQRQVILKRVLAEYRYDLL